MVCRFALFMTFWLLQSEAPADFGRGWILILVISKSYWCSQSYFFQADLNCRVCNIFEANIDVAMNCLSSVTETLFFFFFPSIDIQVPK